MSVQLTTLADFRRFLATPGARVQLIRHDYLMAIGRTPESRPSLWRPRPIKALQTNGVCFQVDDCPGGMWIYWDRANGNLGSAGFRFEGDVVTGCLGRKPDFEQCFQYLCWLEPGEANAASPQISDCPSDDLSDAA